MPTIQTYMWMLQIAEIIKKLLEMVSKGGPKIHQKSLKSHPGTFQGSFECICVPLDHKNNAKMIRRTSKSNQNGDPRTVKGHIKSTISNCKSCHKKLHSEQCPFDFNPGNPCNPAEMINLGQLGTSRRMLARRFNIKKFCQSANQQSTAYQRGRWQGRSLKICTPT